MNRHPRWTARLDAVLARLGASKTRIQEIRAFCERQCGRKPRSPRLKLSQRNQARLFAWAVDPQATYEIQLYLDELSIRVHGEPEPAPEDDADGYSQRPDAVRKREYRKANPEAYREYQKEYMRGYNARKRAQKGEM